MGVSERRHRSRWAECPSCGRVRPVDLIFDALTLPISTGQEEYRTAGIETLQAIKRIKSELPAVRTILGVSNISFGLDACGVF
jgi:5-methyltetrahydrofolate--homocysteine methyltransferase